MWDEKSAKRLGDTLRDLRKARGLSQEALAYQAGITKNQLQLIESGRSTGRAESAGPSNPRMSTLAGLAAILETSVADLMTRSQL
ncbi:helix-turn-helix domain-containing protein [Microbacterium sp. p3-SID338]|uniref:helix-turn-helix domain-containing protein n=1 Tax=Microbacterium sp. p3-SID338 TaxID=2916214 RepID=UPI0037C9E834